MPCLVLSSLFATPQTENTKSLTPEIEKELVSSLVSYKELVLQKEEPDPSAVEPLKKIFDENKEHFAGSEGVLRAALDAVKTYDEVKGPLFVARPGWDKGHRKKRTPPPNDLHWTIFHVMQYVFDEAYKRDSLQKYREILKGFSFGSHVHFPGPVTPPENPEEEHLIKIDADSLSGYRTFESLTGPRRPTGCYVVPGLPATVSFPEVMVGKGYRLRVGAHSWDHTKKRKVLRLVRVSHVYDIDQAEIEVLHPLGGALYIEVPKGSSDGIVELKVKGVTRSPIFAVTPYHKTTMKEWLEVERKRPAPWTDFHTEKFMMQVPSMWVRNLPDPDRLMRDWDASCDAQNELFGQPLIKTRHTHYLQVDLQLRGRAFHPGYPTSNERYDPAKEEEYAGYPNHFLVRGPQTMPNHVIHEQGHAFLIPKYPGERESVVNFPHVAVMNRKFGETLDQAFAGSRHSNDDSVFNMNNTAIAWMCTDTFMNKAPMQGYEKQYQLKGHAKYVEIVRLFGWEGISEYWRAFNDEKAQGTFKGKHNYTNDEITFRKCRAIKADLRPLMRFWGIVENDAAALATQVGGLGLKPSQKVYDRLVHYKSLLPKDNAAFREFAFKWRGNKEPSHSGFTEERHHAAMWESYGEEIKTKLEGNIDEFLTQYFPEGRPQN